MNRTVMTHAEIARQRAELMSRPRKPVASEKEMSYGEFVRKYRDFMAVEPCLDDAPKPRQTPYLSQREM